MNHTHTIDQDFMDRVRSSAHRIYLLTKRDVSENWRGYLMPMLAVFCFFTLVFVFNSYTNSRSQYISLTKYGTVDHHGTGLFIPLLMYGAIFGTLFISAMHAFSTKNKGSNIIMLLLPATTCEKMLSRILVRVVGQMLLLYVMLNLADFAQLLYHPPYPHDSRLLGMSGSFFFVFSDFGLIASGSSAMLAKSLCHTAKFMLSLSFCFLGSAFWNGRVKTKTAFLVLLLLIVLGNIYNSTLEGIGSMATAQHLASLLWCFFVALSLLTVASFRLVFCVYKNRMIKERKLLGIL
ncbi:MAG: hypothetical protein RR280_06990 [Bacteroidaceae bacterium]